MSTSRKEAGDAAEQAALEYLQQQGLKLVLRNYRCRGGEIDLVMLDRDVLALVEVRLRKNARFGGAAASVIKRKQHRITLAARHLLMAHRELARYRARFDVVAMQGGSTNDYLIEWIRDAFQVG
jgi:putative endonuclease